MATPSPELVAAWRRFRAERRAEWLQYVGTVRRTVPGAERDVWTPADLGYHVVQHFLWARKSAAQRKYSPEITWSEEYAVSSGFRSLSGKFPTLRWVDGGYRFVAQVLPDDTGIPDHEGRLTEKAPDYCLFRTPWVEHKVCPTHGGMLVPGTRRACPREGCGLTLSRGRPLRGLRGSGHRFYWEVGGYDRGEGETKRREYQYGVVSDYDYEDLRGYYWLEGHSRFEADILARRAFAYRKKRLEAYAEGQIWQVGVVCYVYKADAECDHCPLEEASVWGIESDSVRAYIETTARDQADEALRQLERAHPSSPSSPAP